jgi:hypothetical protein
MEKIVKFFLRLKKINGRMKNAEQTRDCEEKTKSEVKWYLQQLLMTHLCQR